MTRKEWFAWTLLAACVASVIGLVLLAARLYAEPVPNQQRDRHVVAALVKRGDYLQIAGTLQSDKACAGWFTRSIIDSAGAQVWINSEYQPLTRNLMGLNITGFRSILIPSIAATGPATYRVVVEWMCNPVQRIWPQVEEFPILNFTII